MSRLIPTIDKIEPNVPIDTIYNLSLGFSTNRSDGKKEDADYPDALENKELIQDKEGV